MNADPGSAVDGLVHPETQVHDGAVDLTVANVHVIDEPAHLDFGGSELQLPATTELEPEKRHPDDDYGWWSLDPGLYTVEFNETLTAPVAFIQPREALVAAGAIHPAGWFERLPDVGLFVGGGLECKENARISTLWPAPPFDAER